MVDVLLGHFSRKRNIKAFREIYLGKGKLDLVLVSKKDLSITVIEAKVTHRSVVASGKPFGQVLTYATLLKQNARAFLDKIKSKTDSATIKRAVSSPRKFYVRFFVAFRLKDWKRHQPIIRSVRELLGKPIGILTVDTDNKVVQEKKPAHKRFRIG